MLLAILCYSSYVLSVSNCAQENTENQQECKVCNLKYKLSSDKKSCLENIPNCRLYTSRRNDSCDLCKGGFTVTLTGGVNTCSPNFVGDNQSQCKPGFILSGMGFCVFTIQNCMRYSADKKDENGNHKCDLCYQLPEGKTVDGVRTASYLLSTKQTKCFPKIKGCAKQLDNKCQESQDQMVVNPSGLWICTTCAAGFEFKVESCVREHDLPCVVKGSTATSDSLSEIVTVQVGYGSEATCFENPTHLIPHCTVYNADGTCNTCDSPLGSDCLLNQYGYYAKECIAKLQFKPKYMLYKGNCIKEMITCRVQEAEKCKTCYFFYKLINDNNNCLENDKTYPDRSSYSKNVKFYKQWTHELKKYSTGKVFTTQATSTQVYSQKEDIWAVMQQEPTIKDKKQVWDSYTTKPDRQTIAYINNGQNVLKINNAADPKMWVTTQTDIGETIWSEPLDDDTWSKTRTSFK